MRYTVTYFARDRVGLSPFRASYAGEFELSYSNPVNRIIKFKSISKYQLLFHWKNFEKYMIFYTGH